ncbi:DUF1345 domain-containing protein [Niabella aquatica]
MILFDGPKNSGKNVFQKLHPVHRSLIGLAFAALTFFLLPAEFNILIKLQLSWTSFAIIYIICCWVVVMDTPVKRIKNIADKEDGSKVFVFSMILLTCIASFCAVFFIVVSQKEKNMLLLIITMAGMLISWFLVHTVFLFHYAHLYYKSIKIKRSLEFPGNEDPDYLDFAYFSIVMGCTFQVSDVSITDKTLRRVALFHGLLSFLLNTFVIALSINIISGLIG